MSSFIIGFIIFVAFARAAREYGKNPLIWGAAGLLAFFGSQFVIAIPGGVLLVVAGAPRATTVLLIADFILSAMISAWTYNKLMNSAIREMAARDAAAPPSPPPIPGAN